MKLMRIIPTIVVTTSLLIGFQNCSKTGVAVEDMELSSIVDPNSSAQVEATKQIFSSASTYKAVDMVWVVDNSVSMVANVTQTKKNLQSFFSSLQKEMDINVTLITKQDNIGLNTNIQLSDYTSLGQQINFMIHSYNPMLVAAIGTCPDTPAITDVLCTSAKNNFRYKDIYGSLNKLFRVGSLKVFVFVTDDDSSSPGVSNLQYNTVGGYYTESRALIENEDFITPDTFRERMTSAFGSSSSFKSFGFISLDNGASCRARISAAYANLNVQSGGSSFDICASDWSANFSSLTNRVKNYANTTYIVDDVHFISVVSVDLDGKPLVLNKDYTLDHNVVMLKQSLVEAVREYEIVVNYDRKTH